VDPESVSEDQINKISMGIYHDEHLREKAISLLIDISLASPNAVTETAARSLNDALTNKEAITRKQAARAVTNFCQTQPSIFEDSVQTIINIISDDNDRGVQRQAAEAIKTISKQEPELLTENVDDMMVVLDDDSLHNDEIAKREAIVTALGNVGYATESKSEIIVDELAEALDDPWKDVREASLSALSTVGTIRPTDVDDVLQEIIEVITDSEEAPGVRIRAVDVIESVGKERPELITKARPEIVDVLPEKEAERPDAVERATAAYGDGETQLQARIIALLENENLW
jgi:HEAT repeat protein